MVNKIVTILYYFLKKSVGDIKSNPDLSLLDDNLAYLKDLNGQLQSGEKNFYECNQHIENCLNQSIKLIVSYLVILSNKILFGWSDFQFCYLDRTDKHDHFH
jgi:hypothetical protein